MKEHGLLPAERDLLMQREHLFRQQRIQLMQVVAAGRPRRARYLREDHDDLVSVAQVEHVPSSSKRCLGNARKDRKQHPPKELAGGAVASTRRLTNEQHEKTPLQREQKQRGETLATSLAKSHFCKTAMLKVWRHWIGVVQLVQVHTVKADRHHQYCVLQGTWTRLMENVTCSRTNKKKQVPGSSNTYSG